MTTCINKKVSYKWHAFSLALVLCLVVAYLVQINNQAEKSFVIKELEEKKQELNDIIEDKEMEVSAVRSLNLIAARAKELNLSDSENVTFIKIGLSTVAVSEDAIDLSP
ncbi:hypothetical protein KKF64_01290 [Patescibacteria group bacterium]|nr:hypothetical protein [Patescibacteria group bacterium]